VTRIAHPPKRRSYLTLLLGLFTAVAIGGGFLVFGHKHQQNKELRKIDYNKPLPSDSELRAHLTQEQYHIVRENGTENAFHNSYWDNHRAGLYVDIITGEPLFSSLDKFDSDNGRPNFSKPIEKQHVTEKVDNSFDVQRTEVRASKSDAHLGHLFKDEKSPTGERYTVNSAALRFIPLEKMKEEGYGDFLASFEQNK
jgi:methionine-R-sulfoxide reductase